MRVAVVAEGAGRSAEADVAVRVGRLAELLAARRHDVTVFCSQWWEGTPREFEYEGVTYRAITRTDDAPSRRLVTRVPRGVKRFDPDVIHAIHDDIAVHAAALPSGLLRVPLVVDWYESVPAPGVRGYLDGLAARVPDLVVTPSRMVETDVRERGRDDGAIEVVPNGVEMDAIRAAEPEPIADIVYSRTLDGDANLESLLLALAELRDVDWNAAVIGDGPERPNYERQARDLRIEDRVEFLGDQPLERRLRVFKGAHVCVHTALRAPFATDFLRALACGCVGIAEYHTDSSAHELIERRERGIRVTSDDELVDALRRAADMGHREVDEAFADYDEREFLEGYLECYRRTQAAYGVI